MIKEFFLVNFGDSAKFTESLGTTWSQLLCFIFPIGAIVEIAKGFFGKSNIESRITYLFLALFSVAILQQYGPQLLDISFSISDNILKIAKIKNMDGLADFSSLKEKIKDKEKTDGSSVNQDGLGFGKEGAHLYNPNKKWSWDGVTPVAGILGSTSLSIGNNIASALAWLVGVIALVFCREVYSTLYLLFVLISPIIAYLSVLPGFEGSIKALWQSYVFFFISPIIFSLIFAIITIVGHRDYSQVTGNIETLIHVAVLAIFLLFSFGIAIKVSTCEPIAHMAEKASLVGAMTMAAPFVGMAGGMGAGLKNPLEAGRKIMDFKDRMQTMGKNLGSKGMGNRVMDISKTNDRGLIKKLSGHKNPSQGALKSNYSDHKESMATRASNQGGTGLKAQSTPNRNSASDSLTQAEIDGYKKQTRAYGNGDLTGQKEPGELVRRKGTPAKISKLTRPPSSKIAKEKRFANVLSDHKESMASGASNPGGSGNSGGRKMPAGILRGEKRLVQNLTQPKNRVASARKNI